MASLTEEPRKAYLGRMATHKSAAKRARQAIKKRARNFAVRSQVTTVEKAVKASLNNPEGAQKALSEAFKVIQKARGVFHRNTVKRKMARLSKVVDQAAKAAS